MPIDDPSIPLQAAIIAALKASGSLAGQRVYDDVPEEKKRVNATGAGWPYIALGEFQIISEKAECLQGAEVYIPIHIWSRPDKPGSVEAKKIGKVVIATLDDADLSNADVTVNSCLIDDIQYLDDPDGITKHAVATFHILTD